MEEKENKNNNQKKEIDWEKYRKQTKELLEKYAKLEEQHDRWNREYHDDEEMNDYAIKAAEKAGMKTLIIKVPKEGE